MTQEEKQLLLKDLCARLPYGVKVHITNEWFYDKIEPYDRRLDCDVIKSIRENRYTAKPYLRSMSSMTMDEQREYISAGRSMSPDNPSVLADWLNAHHFDYRIDPSTGKTLIESNLAIEAPEGMYKKEESEEENEVPIPKTVDEAVKTLAKIVSKEDRDYIIENGAISVHDSMGRWIRNEWGLWTDSELKNELKKKGFEHPDDMSNYIIEEFIKYLNNKI